MTVLPHFTYLQNVLCVALFPYFLLKILAWNHLILRKLSFLEVHQKKKKTCLFTHSLHCSLETLSWNVSQGNCRVPSTDFLLSLTEVLPTDQCVKTVVSQILTVLLFAAAAHLLQLCLTLMQCHGLKPAKHLCPWDSPGKNTGVGCHTLLQGIFLTQGSNPGLLHLLHWQADSTTSCHLGCPVLLLGYGQSAINPLLLE